LARRSLARRHYRLQLLCHRKGRAELLVVDDRGLVDLPDLIEHAFVLDLDTPVGFADRDPLSGQRPANLVRLEDEHRLVV
jgi:hypothetical protein